MEQSKSLTIGIREAEKMGTAARRLGVMKENMARCRPDSVEYTQAELVFDQTMKFWSPFLRLFTRNPAWP